MAIEAITQMWELDGGEAQRVEAFELHDITLITALVIPEDDHGVEVLLNLYPQSLKKGSDPKFQYRFLITSVVDSGGESLFVEHVNGQIGLTTKIAGKFHHPISCT